MSARLRPESPLTAVVEVHDYLQLVFADETLTVLNPIEVRASPMAMPSGAASGAEEARRLVGRRVLNATPSAGALLTLVFEGGAQIIVLPAHERSAGTEAFVFAGRHAHVVEHNA
jgi:hypothetical protein